MLLMWGFSERPLNTVLSSVHSSGGARSVLAGTQASSGRLRPALADAKVSCDPSKSSETVKGSADPSKMASKGSANPSKMASMGLAVPSKTGPKGSVGPLKITCKGSAGPLKNASSKDDSSSSRSSPAAVRVGRVLVDVEGFVHPRHSAPSSGTQAPPKLVDWDRLKNAEQILVLSNQYSALSDDEMDSSLIPRDWSDGALYCPMELARLRSQLRGACSNPG